MSTEVTTLAKALDLICYGDTAAEAQEGHRYLLALEAYKRWAEEVAKPALDEIEALWSDNSSSTTLGIACVALDAYPQPVEETQP